MEFRLIVEDSENADLEKTIQVNGRPWYLAKPLHVDLEHPELSKFTCISYVWGRGREPNPFHHGEFMSSNTISALSSAIAHGTAPAFWIDALCVPPGVPAKHHTLASMGYIYSAAEEVIIKLPTSLLPALNEMKDSDRLSEEVLMSLEQDDWIRSVWTYQEVVNAKAIYFVSGAFKIDGIHFLNCLGHSLTLHRAHYDLSVFESSKKLPKLNALEELLVDWMLGGYTERSAFRVMSQFQSRYNHDPRNYFYSVVGTVVKGPWQWNVEMSIEELAEEFMDVCEQKNDYSFIYSLEPRNKSDPKGRHWRPVAGLLQVILAWHSWGEGQRGHHDKTGFWLEKMIPLAPSGRLGDEGSHFLGLWLNAVHADNLSRSHEEMGQQVLANLRQMAYIGSDLYLCTTHGIFFPQTALAQDDGIEILVAAEVRWAFGAPGVAVVITGEGNQFVPGVFVGDVPELKDLAIDVLLTRNVPD